MNLKASLKLALTIPLVLMLAAACAKKSTPASTDNGSTEDPGSGEEQGPTPGTSYYYTTCTAIGGATIGGATHRRTAIRFLADGGFRYENMFYSNSSCSTYAYFMVQSGTYSLGTGSNGLYGVGFVISTVDLAISSAAAYTDINAGCASWGPYSSAPSIRGIYTAFNCVNINIAAPNTVFYNTYNFANGTVTLGTPDNHNPGVTDANNISASQTLTFQ